MNKLLQKLRWYALAVGGLTLLGLLAQWMLSVPTAPVFPNEARPFYKRVEVASKDAEAFAVSVKLTWRAKDEFVAKVYTQIAPSPESVERSYLIPVVEEAAKMVIGVKRRTEIVGSLPAVRRDIVKAMHDKAGYLEIMLDPSMIEVMRVVSTEAVAVKEILKEAQPAPVPKKRVSSKARKELQAARAKKAKSKSVKKRAYAPRRMANWWTYGLFQFH